MSDLTDAELSLAVARILWPEYEWEDWTSSACGFLENDCMEQFDHTTDAALGKMCVWYTTGNLDLTNCKSIPESAEMVSYRKYRLFDALLEDNPHRAIAEAIVEVNNE